MIMEKVNSYFVITESERKELKNILAKNKKIGKEIYNIPTDIKDIAIKMFLNKTTKQ